MKNCRVLRNIALLSLGKVMFGDLVLWYLHFRRIRNNRNNMSETNITAYAPQILQKK